MFTIVSTVIEMTAAAIYIVPIYLLCNLFFIHSVKRTLALMVFGLYLAAVLALVGFPNISSLNIDLTLNVLPFVGMIADIKNEFLNVLLFIPLGCFLPIMWDEFRNAKSVLLTGIITSIVIELSQIFTFRSTDINDLITNGLGTMVGYVAAHLLTKGFTRCILEGSRIREFYMVCISVVLIMFFIQPHVSSILWAMML